MVRFQRKLIDLFLFGIFASFPFGQVVRLPVSFLGKSFDIGVLDLLAAFSPFLLALLKPLKKEVAGAFVFILPFAFSYLASFLAFDLSDKITGLFYLIRLAFFVCLALVVRRTLELAIVNKKRVLGYLFVSGFMFSMFALFQYLFWPDLRFLEVWGWDEHYLRLAGTLFDPNFTGAILLLALILTLWKYFKDSSLRYVFLSVGITILAALTYSRSTYLALLTLAVFLLARTRKFIPQIALLVLVFSGTLLLAPKNIGEGTTIGRSASAFARLENYKETFAIFLKSPVFGIGFNNICSFRERSFQKTDRACGGSDASPLFLLTTTGVVGFAITLFHIIRFLQGLPKREFLIKGSVVALSIHSLFVNSIFYPFVIVWMIILVATRAYTLQKGKIP